MGSCHSFYDPSTLDPKMRPFAVWDMSRRLLKYKTALADPGCPLRGLEVVTNDEGSAAFIRGLMQDRDVPGTVVIR